MGQGRNLNCGNPWTGSKASWGSVARVAVATECPSPLANPPSCVCREVQSREKLILNYSYSPSSRVASAPVIFTEGIPESLTEADGAVSGLEETAF